MSPDRSDETNKNAGLARQLLAVILISTSMMNFGMMQGWVSPMAEHFKSADSPVGVLSNTEIGLLAAISPFAILTGSFLFGYIADALGRKIGLFLIGVPCLVGGILLTFPGTKLELFIGRGLTGFSAMSFVIGPMYLSETVHDSIRGMLMSITSIPMYIGLLMTYTFGQHLTYKQFNFIFIALPTIHLCTIIFLPETPYFLVSKSRVKRALRSLTWLRGGNTIVANAELKKIQLPQQDVNISFVQTLKMKDARMALMISTVLISLQTVSGINAIINFASMIFTETGSPLTPDNSAVFSSVLLLISTVVCIFLIDRVGRKPLLYCAFVVGFITSFVICVTLFLRFNGYVINHLDWISLMCLGSFIFTNGVGLGVPPILITNEVAPIEIKSFISVVTLCLSMVMLMSLFQTFPIIYESFGMHWNFVIPAISNLLGVFFTWFYVPETKGKSLREISAYLKGSR